MSATKSGWHQCPGGCHALVPNEKLCCPGDWQRLPVELRKEVYRTAGLGLLNQRRRAVLQAVIDFYRANPAVAAAKP